ncbi:UDP-N-acetylglucosamine 2-epimerase, partial [bacterium]|nr:UDP-N-acetylglucosamine 2-epimerase [bacterium]
VWRRVGLEENNYFVVTLHRPANVDEEQGLVGLLEAIVHCARGLPAVFPVHPRTAKVLEGIESEFPELHLVDPMSYLEFNYLAKHAKCVITDSGGITEETTVMGVPCMTLRDSTERPETVTIGTNELLGTDPAALGPAFERLFAGEWKKGGIPEKWDGKTAERIVAVLEQIL